MNNSVNWFSTQAIGKFFRALKGIDFDALNQFVAALRADLDLLVNTDDELIGIITAELDAIDEKKSLGNNWNHAYRAEILLVSLMSEQRTAIELQRRLSICLQRKAPFSEFYRIAIRPESSDLPISTIAPTKQRDLLISIVKDLQWLSSRQSIKMRYARLAIYKVGVVFVLSFFVFIVILSKGHWVDFTAAKTTATQQES